MVSAINHNKVYDTLIVGAGIVGCAVARELRRREPSQRIAILEKEASPACHQSGRNSGVVHAGIYYTPGTLKAKLCLEGSRQLYQYCEERGIPVQRVGKLIVASNDSEVPVLRRLFERGTDNGLVDLQLVDRREAQEIQPGVACVQALWSPSTGITDYSLLAQAYASDSASDLLTHFRVTKFTVNKDRGIITAESDSPARQVHARFVVTAAGLFADKLSIMTGCSPMPAIVPFRGEYLLMKPQQKAKLAIRTNIYPVPDPRFPFLGMHFTPRLDGSVIIGPNAVLAFKREGYSLRDVSLRETWESLTHPGFQALARKYFRKGLDETRRSISMKQQLKHVKRMMPAIELEDVFPGPTGVRAQALDSEGSLIEDFIFETGTGDFAGRVLHVRNAPSPAATAALAIATVVVDKMEQCFSISQHNVQ